MNAETITILLGFLALAGGQIATVLTLVIRMDRQGKQINDRIDAVNARIDGVVKDMHQRFEAVNARFDAVNQEMNKRFDDVNRRFDDVNRRFDDVNKRFDDVNKRFDETIREIGEQRGRMAKLEGSRRLPRRTPGPRRGLSTPRTPPTPAPRPDPTDARPGRVAGS